MEIQLPMLIQMPIQTLIQTPIQMLIQMPIQMPIRVRTPMPSVHRHRRRLRAPPHRPPLNKSPGRRRTRRTWRPWMRRSLGRHEAQRGSARTTALVPLSLTDNGGESVAAAVCRHLPDK